MSRKMSWAEDFSKVTLASETVPSTNKQAEEKSSALDGPTTPSQSAKMVSNTSETVQADGTILATQIIYTEDKHRLIKTTHLRREPYIELTCPAAEHRIKKWKKFGKALDKQSVYASTLLKPVSLDFVGDKKSGILTLPDAEKMTAKALVDLESALKRETQRAAVRKKMDAEAAAAVKLIDAEDPKPESTDVPVAKLSGPTLFKARSSSAISSNSISLTKPNEICSLRISNLSEDVLEDALRVLCGKIAHVVKLYVPTITVTDSTGREYKKNKGHAYVTFGTKRSAEEALKKLHRLPFHHSILSVEWGVR